MILDETFGQIVGIFFLSLGVLLSLFFVSITVCYVVSSKMKESEPEDDNL
jgi:hypothetical protein